MYMCLCVCQCVCLCVSLLLLMSVGAPIQVVPILPAGTPLTPLATPLATPVGTPIRIVGSPTTPQNSQIGFIQKLKTIMPANVSPVVTKHFDLTTTTENPASAVGNNSQLEGGCSSQPNTPHTPVSYVIYMFEHVIIFVVGCFSFLLWLLHNSVQRSYLLLSTPA